MIAKMIKVTFLGLEKEKKRFIQRLQEAGCTHLIFPSEAVEPGDVGRELQKTSETRKFLSRFMDRTNPSETGSDYAAVCARVEDLKTREARLQPELAAFKKEYSRSEAWGAFDHSDLELLRSRELRVEFYRASRTLFGGLDRKEAEFFVTRETSGEVAFVSISAGEADLGLSPEKEPADLARLEADIRAHEKELVRIRAEYAELAEALPLLERAELDLRDDFEFNRAVLNAGTALDERIFILSCWSPLGEKELMDRIGPDFTLAHMASEPEPGDRVPVLLSNPSALESGEDLVKVYSHPNYGDFDPSGYVLYCFAIFFGMIIGDAGYGLILLIITLFLRRKIKDPSPLAARFLRLCLLLSISVFFFGVIGGSYMGIPMGPENPLRRLLLLDLSTGAGQKQVMLVSVIMGMVHISLSLAIKLVRTRDWPSLGWIIVIWSGYFLIQGRMGQGGQNPVAFWAMIVGLLLVLLFTSNSKNPLLRIALGLNGILGIIQLFSDVLSYLRLFALGLATAYMTQTFNVLAGMAMKAIPWVGIIPAILILIGGHTINLVLGVMGGVIHGLRLNFLEWYRWSFEGDGLPFKPFEHVARANSPRPAEGRLTNENNQ
ncbi:MAG: hypothetical protein KKB20_06490 [Proteobacteria bacterium]|nr:hypothetical protein [Pseudomonadota bacterium]